MRVSFTGTRAGMTPWQSQLFTKWVSERRESIVSFAHGCCSGSDVDAHRLVREICGKSVFIAVFPSTAKTRASIPDDANYVAAPKPPLDRDRDIVGNGSDVLLATPKEIREVVRSGTWATVRYARKKKVRVEIFYPCPKDVEEAKEGSR